MNQYAMNRTAQRRIEYVSEAEYDAHAPPCKRRKMSTDSTVQSYTGTSYENTHTHDNARAHYGDAHYGHVYNNYMAQAPPSNTPHMPSPVFQDLGSDAPDTVSLIMALRFDDMNLRLHTMRAAYDGTCEWLFKSKEYMTWRDPSQSDIHKGFLWIRGKPGSGKSTLMKAAYDHGVETFKEDVVMSYFFSTGGKRLHGSAEGMYRSLLCQLLEDHPHTPGGSVA
ncbi:hypothetical protein MBLNU13_g07038t1 [Cladosporium sp. NU13]